jgi:K(+)-stimulated pyrophosphate-energized sodium pump
MGAVITFISLIYAWILRGNVLKKDKGTEKMQEVWNAIRVGADSYLNRQLKTIAPIILILTVALFLSIYIVPPSLEAREWYCINLENVDANDLNALTTCAEEITVDQNPDAYQQTLLIFGFARTVAFIMGASFSLTVGQLGMRMAIQASVRAASAARRGFNESLSIAYYAGTITGMLTDGLGLFGGTIIFIIFGRAAPDALLGFGFGGTLIALFMRVGGGIYTKAADVGADLVGKVEQDIPEDDPRNAAVVADLVGDNVGDCAGMAADIFESYEVTIVSGLILGLALVALTGDLTWIVYPLLIRAIGVISSILGTFTVPIWERFPIKFLRAHDAEEAMFRSYEVSSINTIFWAFLLAFFYAGDWKMAMLTTIGVGLAVAFNPLTSYLHLRNVLRSRKLLIQNRSYDNSLRFVLEWNRGMALIAIAISFIMALVLYSGEGTIYVLYAVAMIGIGMLSHTGNNVAMDSYGPISDNANGIGEMSWHDIDDDETRKARQIMADLDAVGNTTKAITKGIAIASAVIAAVSLFASYITDVSRVQIQLGYQPIGGIDVANTKVFVGLLLGGALPWLFSSLSIRAVSRAAGLIVEEVRRQFRIPGIMEGRVLPDYARVVGISTSAAQKELIPLATISVLLPIAIGLILQVEALGGFLAGIILCGQLLAVFMANAGGAWDNAKKSIEDEIRDPSANTGKGSERHKAGVVGDTVGDPLKDTAGPALNPMIKVVNLVSLIIAPVIVKSSESVWLVVIVGIILIAAVIWAIRQSKKPAKPLEISSKSI